MVLGLGGKHKYIGKYLGTHVFGLLLYGLANAEPIIGVLSDNKTLRLNKGPQYLVKRFFVEVFDIVLEFVQEVDEVLSSVFGMGSILVYKISAISARP